LEAMDLFPDLLSSLVDLLLFAAKRTNHADRFIRQAACLGLRELEGAYPCVLQQYGGHVLAYLALERSFVWQGYVLLLSAIVKNLCTTFFAGSSQSLTKTSSGGSPFSSVSSISSLSSLASASAHAPQPSPSPSPSRLHPSSSTSSFSSLHHQSNHHHTQNSHHHQHYQQYQQQHHHQHHQQHQQQQQQHHHQQQHQHAHAPHLTSASSLPASAASFKIRPLTIGPPQADSLLALPFDPSAPPPFSLPLPWGLLLTRQQGEESEGRGGGAELGGVEIVPSQLPIAGQRAIRKAISALLDACQLASPPVLACVLADVEAVAASLNLPFLKSQALQDMGSLGSASSSLQAHTGTCLLAPCKR
ncbi:unnamed protein product, partial [Closterium sp. NIES-54]